MSVFQWLTLLGVPSLIAALVGVLVSQYKQLKAVKAGVQALLRDRLLQAFKHSEEQGWADYDDRSNVENLYLQYHCLGVNGVMDDMHRRFLELPHKPPDHPNDNHAAA